MLLSLVYFAVRRLLRLLAGGGKPDDAAAREIEIRTAASRSRRLSRELPAIAVTAWLSAPIDLAG